MRNSLYFIALSFILLSCASNKPAQKAGIKPANLVRTTSSTVKPPIKHDVQGDYYTVNIADGSKNDNTVSYGSIVTAKPEKYKVVRTFFPALAQNFRQKYLIFHYTALDNDKSATVLSQKEVSAHYLVNDKDDKEIYQLVDENKRAYHAGISAWRNDKNLNDTSIGIEIVNLGYTVDASGKKIFAPFSDDQIKKVAALAKDIVNRYMIPPTNVLAHSDIAPSRKQDPGPNFPWKKLYDQYQIGMWYDEATKQSFLSATTPEVLSTQMTDINFIFKVQNFLHSFGYDLALSGSWDAPTQRTLEAFQCHFRPEKYDGVLDVETLAILQALLQKYSAK